MRQLLYIPIIHSEADLGSVGTAVTLQSTTLSGERHWAVHKKTICKFWESVATYLRSFDSCKLVLYQDGLAADGEIGRRIAEEAAKRGSKNYQLLLELLNRGAQLRKTEDLALLLLEHQLLLEMVHSHVQQYESQRDRLMEERDKFIAETIEATLKEGELGVLFIGAYHNVSSHLATDISIEMVKDTKRVKAYLDELFLGHDYQRLEELGQYLISPML